jgi:hypothetical protein
MDMKATFKKRLWMTENLYTLQHETFEWTLTMRRCEMWDDVGGELEGKLRLLVSEAKTGI